MAFRIEFGLQGISRPHPCFLPRLTHLPSLPMCSLSSSHWVSAPAIVPPFLVWSTPMHSSLLSCSHTDFRQTFWYPLLELTELSLLHVDTYPAYTPPITVQHHPQASLPYLQVPWQMDWECQQLCVEWINEHQSSKVQSVSLKPEANMENNREDDQINLYIYYFNKKNFGQY